MCPNECWRSWRREAELTLRSGADNNLIDINIGRLLDRERNSAGNRIRPDRHLAHCAENLGLHLRIGHGFREVCPNEARRNDRHAQLIAGLLAQTLGDRAHGELRAGINRHGRFNDNSSRRSNVNKMPETLMAEDRQRCGDAVQNALDVDVDHLLPIRDAQVVEGGKSAQSRHYRRERQACRTARMPA